MYYVDKEKYRKSIDKHLKAFDYGMYLYIHGFRRSHWEYEDFPEDNMYESTYHKQIELCEEGYDFAEKMDAFLRIKSDKDQKDERNNTW
jgi:hypothetical protein